MWFKIIQMSAIKPRSLGNYGNTCYLNALFQSFAFMDATFDWSCTPEIPTDLFAMHVKNVIRGLRGRRANYNMREFVTALKSLGAGEELVSHTRQLKSVVCELVDGKQQDADEVLKAFLTVKDLEDLADIMSCTIEEHIVCPTDGCETIVRVVPHQSVIRDTEKTVASCLTPWSEERTVTCEQCDVGCEKTYTNTILHWPKVLRVDMNRSMEEMHEPLNVPLYFRADDTHQYCLNTAICRSGHSTKYVYFTFSISTPTLTTCAQFWSLYRSSVEAGFDGGVDCR